MNKKEKIILKKAVKYHQGLLSPAIMINSLAERDQKSVEVLVVNKYLEEVPREHNGEVINFYRVTAKGYARNNIFKWFWYKGGALLSFVISASLGALLALGGNIFFNFYLINQDSLRLANQIKWEIYEDISDVYSGEKSYKQEQTFKSFDNYDPNKSILDTNSYYWTLHSKRDQIYEARSGSIGILKDEVMKDVLDFYSLLDVVDKNEKQLESIFTNKVSAKVSTVKDISFGVADNTRKMRTIGAQAIGKIMYYYNLYDFDLRRKDEKQLTTEAILHNLLIQTNKYIDERKTDDIVGNAELAEYLNLTNSEIYSCYSSLDVCALATSHFLMLQTGKMKEEIQIYNGLKKK